ncbi:MAG TPA: siderophore-interacting protein [Streptosporangiaceae bacterium]|nr:siderophore-interacting protein [Streptosporangiaceae bacterium]
MTEPAPVLNDPFAVLAGPLAGTTRMRLAVVSSHRLSPGMQRLVLTAPELAGLAYQPGQDLMLMVGMTGDRPVRRRYTIAGLDRARQQVTLDVVRHGDGPGERWVAAAQPGDQVEGIGPRGKIFPDPAADWHLFAGDESALPAFFVMAGALPAGARALLILEVPGGADERELVTAAGAELAWLHRDGRPAGEPAGLVAAVTAATLPPGRGHAYLAGEASVVLALREALAARGLAPEQMSPKAYWGRGRANAANGEPAKDG